jgi:hypothetical protein
MRKEAIPLTLILIILSIASNRVPNSFATEDSFYPLNSVYAMVIIESPIDNGSYLGNLVTLNASVLLSVYANASQPGIIPYQNVSCFYSLDNEQWVSVPFCFTFGKGVMPSVNEGRYYDQITCFYSKDVENLSEAWHQIRVAVKPDILHSHHGDGNTLEGLVNFSVTKQSPVPTQSPEPQPEPFPATLAIIIAVLVIIATIALVVVILAKLLVYYRKN